jgi:hypothetical protein
MFSNLTILILSMVGIIVCTFFINKVETYRDSKILDIQSKLMKVDPDVTSKLNIQAGNQSFTEDKKDMFLCLRDEQGKYYPDNMLMYVALHELAHAKSHSIDTNHSGDEFKNNFNYYLKKAEELGFYSPSKGLVREYCGVKG